MRTRIVVLVAGLAASLLAIACESSSSSGATPFDVPDSGGFDAGGSADASVPNEPLADAGAPDAKPQDSGVDAADAATDAGVSLQIISTAKAAATVDLTGQEFGAPTPDGNARTRPSDVVIQGAFDAVLWVSTDAAGAATADSHEWDTVVGVEPLPNNGAPFVTGSETWTVAVADGATLLNDAQGHVALPAGTHDLTLSCASTIKMVAGQNFRIYARQSGVWVAGPVFTW